MTQINDENKDLKKQMNYIELKLNLLMKNVDSKTAVKWDDENMEQVPKTVLEEWEDLGKKENGNR